MRIAITGASGFIGRHALAAALAEGHEVHVLGRHAPPQSEATFHRCDLLEGGSGGAVLSEIRAEALLHLAWNAEPGKFWTAPDNLDWVAASLLLARNFAAAGGRRLVVAGSCAEYDWSDPMLDERTTALHPATLYGRCKAALFQALEAAAPTLGLSFGWGRILFPYGPGDRPERLIGTLIAALRDGQPAQFSAGTQERDFIHVADVGNALVALLTSEVSGAVNIGSGQAVAVRDLIAAAAGLAALPAELHFGERPFGADEPARLVAAIARLRDEVGFVPRYSLRAGLIDTLAASGLRLKPE
jgi:nucleoside-diphosphate-sugar epimerase